MPRRVFVQAASGSFDLVEGPAQSEAELQEIVKTQPQLMPAEDLGLDGELLVVGRETTLASGSIDLLCLARSGDVVLIEFKTGPNNPDFRHALGQTLDYGSDLWRLSIEDFDRGVVQRYLRSERCPVPFRGLADLDAAIGESSWGLSETERQELRQRLSDVLATGDFIYVVAAQRFTATMMTSLEYLNATMRYGRFHLVEVVRLDGQNLIAYAAQVVAGPPRKPASAASATARQANEAEFLSALGDASYANAMQAIFAACQSLGVAVQWGSVGASIRLSNPDKAEPLSVGWAFPSSGQWYGARHLTLGVDESSLQQAPTVAEAVRRYIDEVSRIPSAKRVASKLHAYYFEPAAVAGSKDAVIAALEDLVSAASEPGEGA